MDYITNDKIKKGATMALVYPPEMLAIPSPVAIFKGTPNLEAAKKFVDFLLSKEGQEIVVQRGHAAGAHRRGRGPAKFGLSRPDEAVKRAMKVDYLKMIAEKEATIKKFTDIMQEINGHSRAADFDTREGVGAHRSAAPLHAVEVGSGRHADSRESGRSYGTHRGASTACRSTSGTGSVSPCSGPRGAARPWCCG